MTSRPADAILLGKAPEVDALVDRAVDLAFVRLRMDRLPPAESSESIVDLLDSGTLDEPLELRSPPPALDLQRRRYSDSKPFSHEDWKRRHGIDDSYS